jgi:hypothetical protein
MSLTTHEECKSKSKVFAELKRGYPKLQNSTEQQFSYVAPSDAWLNGARPPYNVRWYSPDSPQVTKEGKKAGVYIEGTSVSGSQKLDSYVGGIPGR